MLKSNNTNDQYDQVIDICKKLFEKKTRDYGTAWRILRPSSITDQIFIKASRIRSIQESGNQKIDDPIEDEFIGMINYAIMGLIQLKFEGGSQPIDMDLDQVMDFYDEETKIIRILLNRKNHDYGEAWRSMRISSIVDLILMKIHRIKSIEDNQGKTEVSEGIDAGYQDIVNYSVFSLILMGKV